MRYSVPGRKSAPAESSSDFMSRLYIVWNSVSSLLGHDPTQSDLNDVPHPACWSLLSGSDHAKRPLRRVQTATILFVGEEDNFVRVSRVELRRREHHAVSIRPFDDDVLRERRPAQRIRWRHPH